MSSNQRNNRSRSRGSSRARNSRAAGSAKRGNGGTYKGASGGSGGGFSRIAAGGVILIVAIAVIAGIMKGMNSQESVLPGSTSEPETSTETETVTETETEILTTVSVGGIDITGLSRADAEKKLDEAMPWSMTVTYNDEVYEVSNLIAEKIHSVLDEVYSGIPEESYELDASGMEDAAAREAAAAAGKWDRKAKNGSIDSYDADSDKFVFSGAQSGISVDQEKLASDILSAMEEQDYGAAIAASVSTVDPEVSESAARDKYSYFSFTTNTTANEKRNTNIKLAARAINGTVLQPGEEFSFNGTVGERTEAKGYQGAAAYNNGEVVQEIGGGVCQVSSTLYNAVVKAGLKTTKRQSHTFEPNYVTPGTDATVSWGGPDYKFVNNTDFAVGIKASYASRELTVRIYAVPEQAGVTRSLKSTKIKDYTTGTDAEKNSGLQSKWETRLVVTQDGNVISSSVDHTTTYKSHTKANDAAEAESIKAAEAAASEAAASSEAAAATIEASSADEGEAQETAAQGPGAASAEGNTGETISAGPGSGTIAPAATTAAETTAAAATAAAAPTSAETAAVSPAPGNSSSGPGSDSAAPGSSSEGSVTAGPGSDSQAPGSASQTVETIAPMPGA